MKSVLITVGTLLIIFGLAIRYAPDASACGAARHAGCSASIAVEVAPAGCSASAGSCAGEHSVVVRERRWWLGKRLGARREARTVAGCGGEAAGCSGQASGCCGSAGCSQSQQAATPAPVNTAAVCPNCDCGVAGCVCNADCQYRK